ncbi:MAG: glycosyltransferase family 4 protein [Bacteroidales bacterium]|nr:glycosyltransferase family 4 protein [Bacteroidales bacterium]
MKRVLIITYYWPPSGGSGVQRWLKMSKYLPENGWQPVIYTAEDAEYPVEDKSLEKDVAPEAEVIRRPIVEPYSFYKKFLGIKKGEKVKAGFINEGVKKSSWKENISLWIRGNFFIPDARRWWIKPSVKYLSNYLKEHPVDAMISTGPPHSMHLIAKALHKKFNIPWVADFRDPWTEIFYFDSLKLTKCSIRKHKKLENQVLTEADKVVAVSWHEAADLEVLGARKVDVVTNGYDEECAKGKTQHLEKERFTISYTGVLLPNESFVIWDAIKELCEENAEFNKSLKINLIGHIDESVKQYISEKNLDGKVDNIEYMQHSQVLDYQQKSDLLLLLIPRAKKAECILTGKLFEYLASGRPVLAVGPAKGDAARVLSETNCGITADYDDKSKMKEAILEYFNKRNDNQLVGCNKKAVEKYSRRNLTKDFVKLLNDITR